MNLCSMEIIKWALLQMRINGLTSPKTKSPVFMRRGFFVETSFVLFQKQNRLFA
jgi:hypothetical protein